MVTIIDQAQPGKSPVRPNKTLNIILGIVIGLMVGVGLAFFIEYLDTSVKTIDDVERALQAPVLGVIPQNVGYLIDEGVESQHAEAYRVLRTNLLFSRKDDRLNSVVVVSAGAGEGKSTTVLNLATVFAQSGQRVLLVDSDLRRPTLHKLLKVGNSLGLTNYLLKQNTLEEVIQRTSVPTLDLLASGKLPSSSMNILGSASMKDLVAELKQRYDFVFFDSPPIMGVSDAAILASEMDMVIQVIQYRRYPQPMNIRAKQMIEKVGGNLIGIVLNNINMSQDESYYYYSGYYHGYYYYSKNEDGAECRGRGKRLRRRPRPEGNQTKVLIAPPFSRGFAPMKLFVRGLFACAWLVAGMFLTGCHSLSQDPLFLDNPRSQIAAAPAAAGRPAAATSNGADVARFHVGDTVIVSFSGAPEAIPDHQESIKEDGTITLPLLAPFMPSAKPPGNCKRKFTTATFRNITSA